MNRQELRSRLLAIYRNYVGVAAEFVIDDAFDVIDQHPEWRGRDQLQRTQFLVAIEKLTPAEVPLASLRVEISKHVAQTQFN